MTDKVKQFLIRLIREAKGDSLLIDSENKFMTNEEFEKEWAEAQKYYEKHPEAADLDIIWGFDVPEADGISPIERYVLLKHQCLICNTLVLMDMFLNMKINIIYFIHLIVKIIIKKMSKGYHKYVKNRLHKIW